MGSKKIYTDEEIEWLKNNYATTKNIDIQKKLGICETTLIRLKNKYRLEKDKELYRQYAKEKIKKYFENLRYDKKAWEKKIEIAKNNLKNSKSHYKKGGVSPWSEYSDDRKKEIKEKIKNKLNRLREIDRLRENAGLKKKTKLGLGKTKAYIQLQKVIWRLRVKKGYITDDAPIIYYSEETHRVKEHYFEQRYRLEFKSLEDKSKNRYDKQKLPNWTDNQGGWKSMY